MTNNSDPADRTRLMLYVAELEAKLRELRRLAAWDAEKIYQLVLERNEARRLLAP